MRQLQSAIEAGQAAGKLALYFGWWDRVGHYLHHPNGRTIYDTKADLPGFPWSLNLMDGGLLKTSCRPDVYDGQVFWTCGGTVFWYAFFWWDNSVDQRMASNSGFYVRGFGFPEAEAAFEYACACFPKVVSRQAQPLILRYRETNEGGDL